MNARAKDMPVSDQPLSERYRLAANAWVEADAVARRLEELKTTALEQQKQALIQERGHIPDSHAEREVKSAPGWEQYITSMVNARTAANKYKITMEVLRMEERELRDRNETIRAEMRLSR